MTKIYHPSITKTCEYCYKPFKVHVGNAKSRRFCSKECKLNGYTKPVVTCLNCGEKFEARATKRSETGRQKFCSTSCRWQHERNKTPKANCERCGKEFSRSASFFKWGNPRFCSQSCAGNMKRSENERFTRVKTKTWETIRQSILERDGFKCARCGSREKLTVHHIKRWVFTKDDSPSNLITLCRSCHWSIEWNGVACPTPKGNTTS